MAIAMTAISSTRNGSGQEHEIQRDESNNSSPVQAWWECNANVRSAIQSLISVLGDDDASSFETLLDSESPAKALLDSPDVAGSISARLHNPSSGSASDALCQWLYDTFQTPNQDLQLVVLRHVPLMAGIYLSRLVKQTEVGDHQQQQQQRLAGFEAVLLALYTAEVKARDGRPVLITVPDLAQPSLYHAPRNPSPEGSLRRSVGQLCAPLEPHLGVMSTKRASIVAVALDLFFRKIAVMPAAAKIEACEFVQGWAGQNCLCVHKLDQSDDVSQAKMSTSMSTEDGTPGGPMRALTDDMAKLSASDVAYDNSYKSPMDVTKLDGGDMAYNGGGKFPAIAAAASSCLGIDDGRLSRAKGARIPLPWELLQPILRILGHCLLSPMNSQEVRDAGSVATRMLFARVSHDLVPEAILATRSLIKLDIAARESANIVARSAAASQPIAKSAAASHPKKPEILLVP